MVICIAESTELYRQAQCPRRAVYVCVCDISKKQLQHQWNCEPAQGISAYVCVCVFWQSRSSMAWNVTAAIYLYSVIFSLALHNGNFFYWDVDKYKGPPFAKGWYCIVLYEAFGTPEYLNLRLFGHLIQKKQLMTSKQWDIYSVIVLHICLFCLPDLWGEGTDALPCRKCEVAKSLM